MLEPIRTFIYCRHDITWADLRRAGRDHVRVAGDIHTLSVNRVWASVEAVDEVGASYAPISAVLHTVPCPYIEGCVVLGSGSLKFCKAVRTLIEDGLLQVLRGGKMRYAIDRMTGYHYGYNPRREPKIPDLHVAITPGD